MSFSPLPCLLLSTDALEPESTGSSTNTDGFSEWSQLSSSGSSSPRLLLPDLPMLELPPSHAEGGMVSSSIPSSSQQAPFTDGTFAEGAENHAERRQKRPAAASGQRVRLCIDIPLDVTVTSEQMEAAKAQAEAAFHEYLRQCIAAQPAHAEQPTLPHAYNAAESNTTSDRISFKNSHTLGCL